MPSDSDTVWLESCPVSSRIAEEASSHSLPSSSLQIYCTKLHTACEEHHAGASMEQHSKIFFWDRWFDILCLIY